MAYPNYRIIIDCNEPAKDSLEPLLKALETLGNLGCSRSIKIDNAGVLDEFGLTGSHDFDGDGPDRITKLTVEALDSKEVKASLIDLGYAHPELRPHLREVIAALDKRSSRESLAMMHAQFVSKVENHLARMMRDSPLDSTIVHIQLSLSVVSGYATLIYRYGKRTAEELRFEVTASPKIVALRLLMKMEAEV